MAICLAGRPTLWQAHWAWVTAASARTSVWPREWLGCGALRPGVTAGVFCRVCAGESDLRARAQSH
eukprot:11193530-Lingulodinium_polyedra.AAC.1